MAPRSVDHERSWLSRAFAALSDPLTRDILETVKESPGVTVTELCDEFPVSRFTIMRQLNALEDAYLLRREREGKTKRIFLQVDRFQRLSSGWLTKMGK